MKLQLLWKYYWPAIKRHPWICLGVSFFMGAAAFASSVLVPLATKNIFDFLEKGIDQIEMMTVKSLFVDFVIVFFLMFVLYRIGDYLLTYVQPRLLKLLQDQTSERVLRHSYKYFADNFGGSLVAKSKRFVDSFETLQDQFAFRIWTDLVHVISTGAVLIFLNTYLALIFVIWLVSYVVVTIFLLKMKMKRDLDSSAQKSVTTGAWSDMVTNVLNIKMFASQKREGNTYAGITEVEQRKKTRAWMFNSHMNVVQGGMIVLFQITIFGVSIYLWSVGAITLGVVTVVYMYAARMFDIVFNLGSNLKSIITAIADAQEMTEVFEQAPDVQDPKNPKQVSMKQGAIDFNHVVFGYEDTQRVFDGLNLSIASGERVALVGHSGAGKTTITKLLLRFSDIQSGEISIDGQDISQVTQDDLRSHISYVPQDPILFHRSLRENIAYGNPNATEEEIVDAAKKANAHDFIMSLSHGYDTLVGERGIKLSGGERQRVAIARAMLKDAPVLLLDEATSALDSITEQQIQESFDTLSQGRTTIVIAHRLSTIVSMDRIVVFEKGKVIEQGSHSELLEAAGIYAELWNSQSNGFIGE